jgi:MFS family permease
MPGFGGLASLIFAPYIADGLGRRHGTAIGCVIVLLGALIQSFPPADNPVPMYLAGRFIIGIGATIGNATCPMVR